jgi:site-specific DNA-methyltransferase (adenine-specific)
MTFHSEQFSLDYTSATIGNSLVIHADSFDWLARIPQNSIHAVVTDPPYGIKEYELEQLKKKENGKGGIWRIPPSFDGSERSPLPRFTALNSSEIEILRGYFIEWGKLILKVLSPGGHVFVASNAYLSQTMYNAISQSGFEFRGEIIRLVRTLRGGDRPKNAEKDFPDVCSLPRGCYEPWGLFRKPLPKKMTVSECLREFQTGGLRRDPDGKPFSDVIESGRTPALEKKIANHPSLKPQAFLRKVVSAALPLGQGIILDPFMGSGSTIAAAEAVGYSAIGIERHPEYYQMSLDAIPHLSKTTIVPQPAAQLLLPLE